MAARKKVVKKLATIWECPDDLWENVVVPVLDALDPAQDNGRPRIDPRLALNGIIHQTPQKKRLFGSEQVTTPLIAALDDADPEIVQNAMIALSQVSKHYFKDDRAYARIVPLMRSEHGFTYAWAIAAVLGLRGVAGVEDVLPLAAVDSPKIRSRALGEIYHWLLKAVPLNLDPKTRARLRTASLKALSDASPEVRGSAAELLAKVGETADLTTLQKMRKKETDIMAQGVFARAIESFGE